MKKSRPEYLQKVHLEKSRSLSGKHAFVSKAFIVDKSNGTIKRVIEAHEVQRPVIYSKGFSENREVKYASSEVLVVINFVQLPHRKMKRRVKGRIMVFDEGHLVYSAVYREFKIRGSCGNPEYFKYVESVLRQLNIPVKRSNSNVGVPCAGD